jgi:methyltransferase (TIGR00027 family)
MEGQTTESMAIGDIQHVSDTAFLVAQCRAIESARGDALFDDPLAARVASDKGEAILARFPSAQATIWSVAIRTVVIDELIRGAVARGASVVLNLGAGLDTRPYRLDLPRELLWIEVDYPDMLRFKAQRLAGEVPRLGLESVALDLADVPARRAFFAELARRGKRMLVITEGVVPYLTLEQAGELADDLRALRLVDGWIIEYLSPEVHRHRDRLNRKYSMTAAEFKFRPHDWFAFFDAHGWRPREQRYLSDEGEQRGRAMPLPRRVRWMVRLLRPFVPAARRDAMRRALGCILLEPK